MIWRKSSDVSKFGIGRLSFSYIYCIQFGPYYDPCNIPSQEPKRCGFLKHSDASGAFAHGILLKWYNDVLYLLIVRLIICPRREVSSYISHVVNGIAVWITETHTNIKVN